ncbi:MAG: NAD-dependent epimerase/dehydratase family protein [Pirellulaceae bacterium]
MKVAVTGGTGFIGRYILRQLAADGHELKAWKRESSDISGLEALDIDWIEGSLTNVPSMNQLVESCDAVVHSALWKPGATFRGGEGQVARFAEVNVVGTLQLISAAIEAGVDRFVFLSTCAVHEIILDDRPLDEAHPLWTTHHYGAHKAAIEQFVHSFGFGQAYNISALRPTGVYGVNRPVERSKWFDLVREVASGSKVRVKGGGKEVHAADVARAVAILLNAEDTAGHCFNCYDRYIAQIEVAQIAKELSGSDAIIAGEPKQPKHEIETKKIRALGMEFGGTPLLRETIGKLIDSD